VVNVLPISVFVAVTKRDFTIKLQIFTSIVTQNKLYYYYIPYIEDRLVARIEEEIESELLLAEPTKYKVLLHNDDYSTMDFVVDILVHVFRKNIDQAEEIMIAIHESGRAVCGIYTFEIAETKVYQVKELAKNNGFPLLATMEEV
jgi:ATP-dependent Clp protease adaptor protein ClpS